MLPLRSLSLLGRNEVTKLKFEGRTFHIYANQREVRAGTVGNTKHFHVWPVCFILSCTSPHPQRAGRKDHPDLLCAHTGGLQAPLEVRRGEPGLLQVSSLSIQRSSTASRRALWGKGDQRGVPLLSSGVIVLWAVCLPEDEVRAAPGLQ